MSVLYRVRHRCAEWISTFQKSLPFFRPMGAVGSRHNVGQDRRSNETKVAIAGRRRPQHPSSVSQTRCARWILGPSRALHAAIDIGIVPEAFDTGRAVAQLAQIWPLRTSCFCHTTPSPRDHREPLSTGHMPVVQIRCSPWRRCGDAASTVNHRAGSWWRIRRIHSLPKLKDGDP